jgi:uncharacterized protein involved in exopolysaccharide biosynthesis
MNTIKNKLGEIPKQERVFRNIIRQQKIKEELFLYLLQKREEAAISNAIANSNAKIIDYAFSSSRPISPNEKIIYAFSIFFGVFQKSL